MINNDEKDPNENMSLGQRLGVAFIFWVAGLVCFGVNLNYIFNSGWYNPNLSYYGGVSIAIALYIALFGSTDFPLNTKNVLILFLVLIIAFVLGAIFNLVFAGQIY